MSRVLLHDSSRGGKLGWARAFIEGGEAGGLVLSPWQTPPTAIPRRPSATENRDTITAAGGIVIWDPTTHAVHHPLSNDRDCYDRWKLWSGTPRTTDASLRDHVDRCVDHAVALGVSMLAPTLTLESPQGANAQHVLDMAERTLDAAPAAGVTIAGTPALWTAGHPLDTFVGELISLRPGRVNVMMVRQALAYPAAGLSTEEIAGVCRSVHSLALHSEVMVGQGDFAALPAVVAGATLVGSGWDLRHRVCALDAFMLATRRGGGGTPPRVTHGGLLGALKRADAEAVLAANAALSATLVPGALPTDQVGAFRHHLRCLTVAVDAVASGATRSDRARTLEALYAAAGPAFAAADVAAGGLETAGPDWIAPVEAGLAQYVVEEGL